VGRWLANAHVTGHKLRQEVEAGVRDLTAFETDLREYHRQVAAIMDLPASVDRGVISIMLQV
jgi:hypothetical protein